MNIRHAAIRLAVRSLLISTLALTACGGGGGGTTSTPPPPPPPVNTTVPPTLSTMQPDSAPATMTSFSLFVKGTKFAQGAVVLWDGKATETTFLSSTSLSATVPFDGVASEKTVNVTVRNTDGGVSNALHFVVGTTPPNPVPSISSITPRFVDTGSTFRLMIRGIGFRPGTKLLWNGTEIASDYQGENSIGANISGAPVANAATVKVSVQTPAPGGGTSNEVSLIVNADAPKKLAVSARHIVYDSQRQRIYASVSADAVYPNSIVVIDPFTAAILSSIPVGLGPDSLALSQDQSTLWVANRDAGSMQKIDLNTNTSSPEYPLGTDPIFGKLCPATIVAMPGSPQTIAVSRVSCYGYPAGIAIYDNGVARPKASTEQGAPDRIVFGDTPDTLLGTYYGSFRKLSVDADGVTLLPSASTAQFGLWSDIYFSSGRLYSTFGTITDVSGNVVGQLPGIGGNGSSMTRDPATNRVYVLTGTLNVLAYNDSTFLQLGFFPLAASYYYGGRDLVLWKPSGFAFISSDQVWLATGTLVNSGVMTISTTTLPATSPGKLYDYTLSAFDAEPPTNWRLFAGALPPGLELQQSGRITGTVGRVSGDTDFGFTAAVSDYSYPPVMGTKNLSIRVKTNPLGSNNECATATPISPGRLAASLSPYGDVDVYSFDGTAGANISFETFAARLNYQQGTYIAKPPADTVLQLLNSSCSPIALNDDQPGTLDSFISYKLPVTGKYYIRVMDSRSDGRPDFLYDLEFKSR